MFRWIAFVAVLISLSLLTSGNVGVQWIGWVISSCSSLAWAWFAMKDKDTPRMLMEICYLAAGLWGIYNWLA
tara:strand:+ start:1005 stop:1220 length:216 start_codon:yes stop_codon:yes gene_type:complete